MTAVLFAVFAREVLSLHRAFMEARRQRRFEEAHELQAACQVLREQLGSRLRREVEALPEDRRPTAIRVCVYRVAPVGRELSPELERVTPYAVGEGGDPGEVGKRISSACGVIGLSYRTQSPQIGNRQGESIEDFRKEMIAEWGFDPDAARTLNETRWSFLALPIQTPEGKVDAIVFVDSELKNCFMVDVVEWFVMPACDAMRIVIERRYGNAG
ncbi:MAG: hypothetical protein SFY69_02065 [Planctomycetota bacterium]|nr:hypothetical protein [Planctomycetota bacterium]